MKTTLEVQVGPGTLAGLREVAEIEGIDTSTIADQAVQVWSYLRGDERKLVGQVAMGIVTERLKREAGYGAAA